MAKKGLAYNEQNIKGVLPSLLGDQLGFNEGALRLAEHILTKEKEVLAWREGAARKLESIRNKQKFKGIIAADPVAGLEGVKQSWKDLSDAALKFANPAITTGLGALSNVMTSMSNNPVLATGAGLAGLMGYAGVQLAPLATMGATAYALHKMRQAAASNAGRPITAAQRAAANSKAGWLGFQTPGAQSTGGMGSRIMGNLGIGASAGTGVGARLWQGVSWLGLAASAVGALQQFKAGQMTDGISTLALGLAALTGPIGMLGSVAAGLAWSMTGRNPLQMVGDIFRWLTGTSAKADEVAKSANGIKPPEPIDTSPIKAHFDRLATIFADTDVGRLVQKFNAQFKSPEGDKPGGSMSGFSDAIKGAVAYISGEIEKANAALQNDPVMKAWKDAEERRRKVRDGTDANDIPLRAPTESGDERRRTSREYQGTPAERGEVPPGSTYGDMLKGLGEGAADLGSRIGRGILEFFTGSGAKADVLPKTTPGAPPEVPGQPQPGQPGVATFDPPAWAAVFTHGSDSIRSAGGEAGQYIASGGAEAGAAIQTGGAGVAAQLQAAISSGGAALAAQISGALSQGVNVHVNQSGGSKPPRVGNQWSDAIQ